jgi:AraC-like DNA-binding protein
MANTTPKAIVESTLLFHIKTMLDQRPPLSFQQIAEELDFSSQAHLSNLFKRLTGMTPTQYRNRPQPVSPIDSALDKHIMY